MITKSSSATSERVHEPRNILVTGSAGFIGSNFVRDALFALPDARVVSVDALTYAGSLDNLEGIDSRRHTFVQATITDGPRMLSLFRQHEIDTVVHFAAETHVDNSIERPASFIETNVVGTSTLLECARACWLGRTPRSDVRFHHISTDEVYGSLGPDDPPFTETTRYDPNSPYSASKAAADHLVRAYHRTFGLPITISNCSNNYGPRQHAEKFIPTVICSAVAGRPIPVYGDGSNRRDWLYVGDHVAAIVRILSHGTTGATYNVGGGTELANLDIAREICRRLDELRPSGGPHARLIEFVRDRPGHDWRYAVDNTRMQRELGWAPAESFADGLRKTLSWYLART